MPSTDALLAVILLAILANLAVALTLLFVPRLRAAVTARPTAAQFPTPTTASAAPIIPASPRPGLGTPIGVFGPPTSITPTDPETGFDLPNGWARWLDEEDARVRRYRRSATIVLVEIEGLERLIVRLGLDAAARLVPPVAANLRRHARETDRLARLSVARFGVLLTETDEVAAINYVERIRNDCDTWLEAGGVASRLAIGWAEANNTRSMEAAVQAADDRLNADRRQRPAVIEEADDDPFDPAKARASA